MKRADVFAKFLLFLTFVLLICTFVDFLALHDIFHDYVSKTVLSRFAMNTSGVLPTWTDTKSEWSALNVSYFIKSVIIVISFFIIFTLIKKTKNL